jgi:hypothetical protein
MESIKNVKKGSTFLFITISFQTGGVETLLVRMSNWLINNGYKVIILSEGEDELIQLLDKRIQVKILRFDLLLIPCFSRKIVNNLKLPTIDVIYTFRPYTFWVSTLIYRSLVIKPLLFTGVYHVNEYFLKGKNHFTSRYYSLLFKNYFNDNFKVFMNKEVKENHEKYFNRKMSGSKIWPIAIDSSLFADIKRNPKKYKIVSIGRLIGFKTYNIYMIDVVKKLREEGYNVIYEIYGYGELENEMKQRIKKNRYEKYIFLKGKLPYKEITEVLSDAYLFLGMGTSVIEAGLCKVPTIVSIAYSEKAISHGYLYNMPNNNVGEIIANKAKYEVHQLINNLFDMSEKEYIEEQDRTFNYVQKYSLNPLMKDFLNYINKLTVVNNILLFPKKYYYQFYFLLLGYRILSKIASRLIKFKIISIKTKNIV